MTVISQTVKERQSQTTNQLASVVPVANHL